MAERRATNKYYPPDWDPSKGSINRHKKSHPLRDRARKIDQGILVVRFEMPFNIWCSGCNNHIGIGVRYNAEKSKIGNYYTSPIYQFKMKCHLCDNYFVINTDPSKFDYVIVDGARKQTQTSAEGEMSSEDREISFQSAYERAEEAKRRLTNSMYNLERKVEDKLNSDINQPNLSDIMKWRSRWEDSFSANQMLRAQFRHKRKSIEQAKERDKRLLKRASLKISLAESSSSDTSQAKRMFYEREAERLQSAETRKKSSMLETNQFIPRNSVRSSRGTPSSRLHPSKPSPGATTRVQKITSLP